ncbi:hypothetical protein ACWGI8_37915 [Streptomyces sp. NPDC054841]
MMRVSPQRPEEEKPVGWRLIGANNRELGRSAEAFAGPEECAAAMIELREKVAEARVLLSMPDTAGSWTWRLELDGRAVAVAGRPYLRQRECQYNLSQFLAAVPVARLAEGMPSRPRLRGVPLRGAAEPASTCAEQDDDGHGFASNALARAAIRAGAGAR